MAFFDNDAYSYTGICSQCHKHFPGRKREYSCHACQIAALEAKLKTCNDDAEILNQVSEQLLGYREGSDADILARVSELAEMSKSFNRNKQADLLVLEIRKLNDLADDIEAD